MKLISAGTAVFLFLTPILSCAAMELEAFYREKPRTLIVINQDHFMGETETGNTFVQYRILTDSKIRIHKFMIADQFFYMSDRGYIEAESDLSAVSIYLSLG